MSHLKKFSDKLVKSFSPKELSLIVCGTSKDSFLEIPCVKVLNLSKKISEFEVPSLMITAAKNRLISLSSPLVGFRNSLIVVYRELIENQWDGYLTMKESDFSVMINPELVKHSAETQIQEEECPIIPNFLFEVERPLAIGVKYMNLKGKTLEEEFYGFDARVIMHEIDHLQGVVISNMQVCKGKIREKYEFAGLKIVNKYYEDLTKTEFQKLEVLYQKDQKFKKKTDSQHDKNEFFMRIILGDRFEEYQQAIVNAINNDMAKGKKPKP